MEKRTISCTNNNGMTIIFGESFSPFVLCDVDGIYYVGNNIVTTDNTTIDGAIFQGSTIAKRNVVLTVADKDEHQSHRSDLYKCFKVNTKGTLKYTENDNVKVIDYYIESLTITGTGEARKATISLLCPDPFFYDENETIKYMAEWNGSFTFPHNFTSLKEEFGYRSLIKIQNLVNNTEQSNIGLTFKITCSGDVKNIALSHVENSKHMYIGTSAKPFSMKATDVLEITTGVGDKHVYYTTDGVTTEINNYLSEDSSFIQLSEGDNHIAYDADEGVANISIEIRYTFKYNGV